MILRSVEPFMQRNRLRPALARGPFGPKDPKLRRKVHVAIRAAIKLAADRGVQAIPLREAREFLEGMFDDPFERIGVIAAYDHLSDLIVFNPDHPAWSDTPEFLRNRPGLYGTTHRHHIVRHELGHAAHYRSLSDQQRRTLWDAELTDLERVTARMVSIRATSNVKEFVAEVYAGLWAQIGYAEKVLSLYRLFRGPQP
jgi:hypothetical protein